jgi:CRISPR-associated protein Cas2
MAERVRYLVTYDIRDPRRLRPVHRVVLDFGDPLQCSVYVCDLTRVELVKLRAQVRDEMHLDQDSLSIFDLGPPGGRAATRVEHLGVQPALPDDGPSIW